MEKFNQTDYYSSKNEALTDEGIHSYINLSKNIDSNPFDEYGFKPENINTNNVMRSSTTKGPINLAISTITSQPFYDGQEILFIISLKEDWDGNLWQLKNLKLRYFFYIK